MMINNSINHIEFSKLFSEFIFINEEINVSKSLKVRRNESTPAMQIVSYRNQFVL
jgi:hypothetical protein